MSVYSVKAYGELRCSSIHS